MPGPGGRVFLQAYNCQAVVDHGHQVIIAACATNQASDKQPAVVMIEDNIANLGAVPKEVSADPGYYLAPAVANLQGLGLDPFGAPKKTRHGHKPPPAPRGRIPKHLSPRDRMRRKLQTKRSCVPTFRKLSLRAQRGNLVAGANIAHPSRLPSARGGLRSSQ